ncbi:MAG TPA: homoserine O-succinyltransferase [Beijerinckiaceae bacterium]|nr:homoserine O-succinyltransferase [Beijerinckiaceae bacterium]
MTENQRRQVLGEMPVGASRAVWHGSAQDTIEIGLLNNMPDQALRTTERQFLELIGSVAGSRRVRVSRFFLSEVPRSEVALAYLRNQYIDASALFEADLDALILTGQEPRAPNLSDEPYWRSLTNVIDWARDNTISSIWSCLAAHAAVLHLDGIGRQRLPNKLSGVFNCDVKQDDQLLHGVSRTICVPHSRYNGVPEGDLVRAGYRILTRSLRTGPDLFVKDGRSLFIFFQGHPEYDAHTLLGEYRRDMARYLSGEMESVPAFPQDYFERPSMRVFEDFAERARCDRRSELIGKFPEKSIAATLTNRWRPYATAIFGNWLDYVASQKAVRGLHSL